MSKHKNTLCAPKPNRKGGLRIGSVAMRPPSPTKMDEKEKDARCERRTERTFTLVPLIFLPLLIWGTIALFNDYKKNARAETKAEKFEEKERCGIESITYPTRLPPSAGWVHVPGCDRVVACIQVNVYMPDLGHETVMQTDYPHERECTQFGLCELNHTDQVVWARGTVRATYPRPPAHIDCFSDGRQAFFEKPKGPHPEQVYIATLVFSIVFALVAFGCSLCWWSSNCRIASLVKKRKAKDAKAMANWNARIKHASSPPPPKVLTLEAGMVLVDSVADDVDLEARSDGTASKTSSV